MVGRSAGDFAALEPQCRECLRTGEYDLLAELAQPHRLSELVDGNRVIDKSAGEREIRIVGTISDDDVSLTGIRQKHLFQIFDALRGDGGGRLETTVFDQHGQPVQDGVGRLGQVQEEEPVRGQRVPIRETVIQSRARPFLGQLDAARAIESAAIIVVRLDQPVFRMLDDMRRAMPQFDRCGLHWPAPSLSPYIFLIISLW